MNRQRKVFRVSHSGKQLPAHPYVIKKLQHAELFIWWAWGDSNSHVFRHTLLRRTRLPVTPHALRGKLSKKANKKKTPITRRFLTLHHLVVMVTMLISMMMQMKGEVFS